MLKKERLISLTTKGLYCREGDFYIDPWKPVKTAVITHAHSDHCYSGHGRYVITDKSLEITRTRLGEAINISCLPYGETIKFNNIRVSFHPAGHVLGSAQIRVEDNGETWVISGDYKLAADKTCEPLENVKCDVFISEATFALPIYKWKKSEEIFEEINLWWNECREQGKAAVLFAYSLGKAQRILAGIDSTIGEIFLHGSVKRINDAYIKSGIDLPSATYASSITEKSKFKGGLIVAPPSAAGTPWLRKFGPISTAFASGWMLVRGARRRRAMDRGFVLSDHADWVGLQAAIKQTGAKEVFVTHGYIDPLVKWLNEAGGVKAYALESNFTGDEGLEQMPAEGLEQ